MGRILDAVKSLPGAENTVFIYIAGDNGSSAEGRLEGSLNENPFFNGIPETWQENIKAIDELGGPKHFNHFPSAWAHAVDTPFQWAKQIASHFGGTRNPSGGPRRRATTCCRSMAAPWSACAPRRWGGRSSLATR
jgi:arylsulfatase A-like enzyme